MHLHLYKDKKRHPLKLHRLIAETFIDNPKNKPAVNHKNKDRSDNRVDNLEWMTTLENNVHKVIHNFNKKPSRMRKVWKCDLNTKERLVLYENTMEAALSIRNNNIHSLM